MSDDEIITVRVTHRSITGVALLVVGFGLGVMAMGLLYDPPTIPMAPISFAALVVGSLAILTPLLARS